MIVVERCRRTSHGNCLGRCDFPGDGCRSWKRGRFEGNLDELGVFNESYPLLNTAMENSSLMSLLVGYDHFPGLSSDGRVHFLRYISWWKLLNFQGHVWWFPYTPIRPSLRDSWMNPEVKSLKSISYRQRYSKLKLSLFFGEKWVLIAIFWN